MHREQANKDFEKKLGGLLLCRKNALVDTFLHTTDLPLYVLEIPRGNRRSSSYRTIYQRTVVENRRFLALAGDVQFLRYTYLPGSEECENNHYLSFVGEFLLFLVVMVFSLFFFFLRNGTRKTLESRDRCNSPRSMYFTVRMTIHLCERIIEEIGG